MIDTVCIKHTYDLKILPCHLVEECGANRISNRLYATFVINPNKGEAGTRTTILYPPDGRAHVSVEFEASKLIRGHNALLPNEEEAEKALILACNDVESKLPIRFSPSSAIVSRVDFARDIAVGEWRVLDELDRIYRSRLPHFGEPISIGGKTVYFKTKSTEISAYSKLHHVLGIKPTNDKAVEAARGNLRIEYRFKRHKAVKRLVQRFALGNQSASVLLKATVSDQVIGRVLEALQVNPQPSECEPPIEILLSKVRFPTACRLAGFMEIARCYGSDIWKDPRIAITSRTVKTYLKELDDVGLSLQDMLE